MAARYPGADLAGCRYLARAGCELSAAPDIGASKRVREFAKVLNCDMVICDKERKRANEVSSMVVIGDVKDKNVILPFERYPHGILAVRIVKAP